MREKQLWNYYSELHQNNPRSDSEAKVNFYNQHSRFIIRNSQTAEPEISVIIPAHNESALIPRNLASINQALDNYKNIDVVVIDNASTDDTADIAKTFGARVIKEPRKGIGQARQTGLEAIPPSVKYVLTTDADSVVPPNWFCLHTKLLGQKDVVFAYGGITLSPDYPINYLNKIMLSAYSVTANNFHLLMNFCKKYVSGGANASFIKEVAKHVGGYNVNLLNGEDSDLMCRVLKQGSFKKICGSNVLSSARRVSQSGILKIGLSRLRNNSYRLLSNSEEFDTNVNYEDFR